MGALAVEKRKKCTLISYAPPPAPSTQWCLDLAFLGSFQFEEAGSHRLTNSLWCLLHSPLPMLTLWWRHILQLPEDTLPPCETFWKIQKNNNNKKPWETKSFHSEAYSLEIVCYPNTWYKTLQGIFLNWGIPGTSHSCTVGTQPWSLITKRGAKGNSRYLGEETHHPVVTHVPQDK